MDNASLQLSLPLIHVETHKHQLIPTPWCDGPSITIPTPRTCHNILPGNCDICGFQNPCMYSVCISYRIFNSVCFT